MVLLFLLLKLLLLLTFLLLPRVLLQPLLQTLVLLLPRVPRVPPPLLVGGVPLTPPPQLLLVVPQLPPLVPPFPRSILELLIVRLHRVGPSRVVLLVLSVNPVDKSVVAGTCGAGRTSEMETSTRCQVTLRAGLRSYNTI